MITRHAPSLRPLLPHVLPSSFMVCLVKQTRPFSRFPTLLPRSFASNSSWTESIRSQQSVAVQHIPAIMKFEGSLPCSYERAIGPCPTIQSTTSQPMSQNNFNIILHCTPGPFECSLSFRFSDQNSVRVFNVSWMSTACLSLSILLYLIVLLMFGDEYRRLSTSLTSFNYDQSLTPSCFLVWNVLLNTWRDDYSVMMDSARITKFVRLLFC